MTHADIFAHFRATCYISSQPVPETKPVCYRTSHLDTDTYAGVFLPPSILLAGKNITDCHRFVSTCLTRLADGPPILKSLAEQNIKPFIAHLSAP